ncbi:N-acetyl-gamma-glutamyl-phosphate reductase [Adhaeribacter sp. BT258]|uniref:N-acetyl-gamma-glutamyl-phosphate reductase n=1 Tax=Adhaeribacter terrigena TaxID=2793070 RepID=A0ABS1BZX5_9BACT|nr:N-acetyl-gamma-glutamyl-phosphate reductase [Adhaeribacter terrigena]MBK0402623.1 N-acetyl-gamma-glutamyl-phosphate reductase [Adhaeribacter terrigena]
MANNGIENQVKTAVIRAGIVGGAGYTGGELLRLLLHHPQVEIAFVHSSSNGGKPVHFVHPDLIGETELHFSTTISTDIDVLFLCSSHGAARKFMENYTGNAVVIDLSQNFRLKKDSVLEGREFTYGLPELQREAIKGSRNIANPGCFATCIQLALLPLAQEKKLTSPVHISGITGATGAGQSLTETSHFSWRDSNVSAYKVFTHQHLAEIRQSLNQLQPTEIPAIHFVPYRGNFTRGILTTSYLQTELSLVEATALYQEFYASHPFVHLASENPNLKQVVNTNKCVLHLAKEGDQMIIISLIDNLLKGASGQAVQNMNLRFGLEETAGLKLKASAF